jgi:predicted DNA-binding protein YlxM (UPF0122 family)
MSNDPDVEDEELEALEEESSGAEEAQSGQEEQKRYKRLTEAQKVEIRDQFELGRKRMTELADEFGVSRQALHKWFKQDGIKYGSRAHELKEAEKKAAQAVAERYAEKRMTWIEETRISAHKDLSAAVQLAKKIVMDAVRATPARSLAAVDDDLKAAQRFNRILRENYETRLKILNADDVVDKDDLPTLKIDDLTAEQILEFHRGNGVEDEQELQEILKNFEQAKLD